MNKKKIKMLILFITLIIGIFTCAIFIYNKIIKEKNTEQKEIVQTNYEEPLNTGENFKKERKFKTLDVKGIQYVSNGKNNIFRAMFINNSNEKTERTSIKIVLLDENNNRLDELFAVVLGTEPGGSTSITAMSHIDNPYDFIIE